MNDTRNILYGVRVQSLACGWELRLNDCPVYIHRSGRKFDNEVWISKWVITGSNALDVRIWPLPEEVGFRSATYIRTSVVSFYPGNTEERNELFHLECDTRNVADPSGSAPLSPQEHVFLSGKRFIRFERPFELDTHLPRWRYLDGITIGRDNSKPALVQRTQFLHRLLAAKDIDGIVDALRLRDDEYARARSISFEEQSRETRAVFSSKLLNPEFTVRPVDENSLHVAVYAEGKLAALETQDGFPAVVLDNQSLTGQWNFPLLFFQPSSGDFQVIR